MSVLARFRKESPFEARDIAREIEVKLIRLCMNEKYIPKRYRFTIAQSLIEATEKMSDCVTVANSLPRNAPEREKNQRYAYAMCEVIMRKLDLAERLGFSIPEGTMVELIKTLDKEQKAIQGWIAADHRSV